MVWMAFAVTSAVLASASSILQKELLQNHFRSYYAVYAMGGLTQLLFSTGIVLVFGDLWELPAWVLLAGLALGAFNALVSIAIIKGFSMEDVSRVVPIIDSYPMFVVLLGVLFLGESLHMLQWLAAVAIMLGATLASAPEGGQGGRLRLGRAVFLLLLASAGIAVYNVSAKALLDYSSFWDLFALTFFGGAPVFLAAGVRREARQEIIATLAHPRKRTYLFALLQTCGFCAFIVWFLAVNEGPGGLVSIVTSMRPVLVLAYIMASRWLLALLEHRSLSLRAYRRQIAAAGLVTLGVAAIAAG